MIPTTCVRFGLILALTGLSVSRLALGVPAYDSQPLSGLPTSAFANHLSQFNADGAVAFSHYDNAQQAWVTGIWVPRPLYGYPSGYTQLSTYPGAFGATGVWPFIDDAGNVRFYTVDGGAYGSDAGPIPVELLPNWEDDNVIHRSFAYRGLLGWATSDPAPFAGFVASVTTRDGNTFQPSFTYEYSGSLDGGLLTMARPSGDFGSLEILNRLGHQVWVVYDARTDVPGRVRDSDSKRVYAVTPQGTTQIAEGYFLSGRGDVTFSTPDPAPAGLSPNAHYVLLAGPLGPLGPGLRLQADIAGMPDGHRIAAINGAGVILAVRNTPLLRYRVLAGGKSAPLSALTTVPEPANGSYGIPLLNEAGMLLLRPAHTVGGQIVGLGNFLLTPTLDCDVSLVGTQPYRIGDEFDLDVTVRNVAGAPVTDVRVEGETPGSPGITVGAFPSFDIIDGPSPATPLTIAAGATEVLRYRCRATRSGIGEVKAEVKGTAASGNPLRCETTTEIEIELRADLLVKRADEPPAAFALDNVYRKSAPADAQDRRELITAEGETLSFEVRIENDEEGPLALRIHSLETGSTAIPARYFHGETNVTDVISVQGWAVPELAADASVTLRVDFGPTEGAIGGEVRAARLTLQQANGGGPADIVRMEVVNAPPVEVTLRGPGADGLHPQSILAGKGDINAPLAFGTDPAILRVQSRIGQGFVADGVTPLLLEMRVPPDDLAGLPEGVTYDVALEIDGGGSLGGSPTAQRLRLLKDGLWRDAGPVTFTEAENVRFASITPVRSDDLQLTGDATKLRLRLRFTQPGSGAFVTDKIVLVRRPPVALVHGYNTNGDWGSEFEGILADSRGADFVRTIRYGQEPDGAPDAAREATTEPFGILASKLEHRLAILRGDIVANGWAMTRHDVVAHSQGGVLARMLCSQNGNSQVALPFRNPENHYRGRFHRVVTIGSPHNGTRLVGFMGRVVSRLAQGSTLGIPSIMSSYMIASGNSQGKFDPFGEEIQELNNPSSGAPWYPDPGAMFHLVQTSVNFGQAPGFGSGTPSEDFLGLNSSAGPLVLPRGSDGVVDFDSMTATTPEAGQAPPANSHRMPAPLAISHALVVTGGINIFEGTHGQTDSVWVATHVIGALDQSAETSPQERVFGSFRLPALLPQSVADNLDTAADLVSPGDPNAIGYASGPALRGIIFQQCQFYLPDGEELDGPVTWSAERYGEYGLTTEGITLYPGAAFDQVEVEIDQSYWGDVVLYGTARTVSGRVIIGEPFVVESTLPDSATWALDSIEIEPAEGTYPVGTGIEPALWETWVSLPDEEGNGGGDSVRTRRYPRSNDLAVVAIPQSRPCSRARARPAFASRPAHRIGMKGWKVARAAAPIPSRAPNGPPPRLPPPRRARKFKQ